jgi:hypothetical protein
MVSLGDLAKKLMVINALMFLTSAAGAHSSTGNHTSQSHTPLTRIASSTPLVDQTYDGSVTIGADATLIHPTSTAIPHITKAATASDGVVIIGSKQSNNLTAPQAMLDAEMKSPTAISYPDGRGK